MDGHAADKPPLQDILNLFDFKDAAQRSISAKTNAYWEGPANDGITYQSNRLAWEKVCLRPHLLRDVSKVDTSRKMLGFDFNMPVFTSPCGVGKLAHEDGELSVARAAVSNGVTMCVSLCGALPSRHD